MVGGGGVGGCIGSGWGGIYSLKSSSAKFAIRSMSIIFFPLGCGGAVTAGGGLFGQGGAAGGGFSSTYSRK